MKLLPPCRSRHGIAVLVTAFGFAFVLGVLAAPVVQAFTFEDQGVANGDGTRSRIADPDDRISRFGSGPGTFRQGNTTLQFGARPSFDQRYNNERMFQPLGRPGEPDR